MPIRLKKNEVEVFYHFKIHKEKDGYWAECLELEGCHTQGESMDELRFNMEEALNLYLSEPEKSKVLFPLPLKNSKKMRRVEKVKVDPSVAFAMLIRQTRLKHHYTLKRMAEILEYKNLNAYVKLEKPKTANPELKTIANIRKHFSDFPIALVFE
jgi:antitoxin HicB